MADQVSAFHVHTPAREEDYSPSVSPGSAASSSDSSRSVSDASTIIDADYVIDEVVGQVCDEQDRHFTTLFERINALVKSELSVFYRDTILICALQGAVIGVSYLVGFVSGVRVAVK